MGGRYLTMKLAANVTVLVIDDEEPVRQSIIAFLEDCDYQVFGAESGGEGLKIFHKEQPDVVLVDLRMPEMDGLQVLEAVRYVSPETPIIVVSGMGVIADAVEALRLGAWDYVIKPIQDMNILLHAIEKTLERRQLIEANRRYRDHLENEVAQRTKELHTANAEMAEINSRLRKMVATAMEISMSSKFEDFDAKFLEEFGRQMLASGGSLYLREKEGLHLVHSLDPGHAQEFIPFPLDEGSVLKRALDTGQPVLIQDIRAEKNFSTSGWGGYTDGSVLVFPLPDENGYAEGVLSLHSKTAPPFLEQDKEIGAVLASFGCEAMRAAEAARSLSESEETFRAISSSAQDAIIMIDNCGKISFWNEAAETIFGYSKDEVMGKDLHQLLAPARYKAAYEKGFSQFQHTGQGNVIGAIRELAALRKDGSEFPIELSLSSIKLHEQWHAVGVIRDITERKRAEEALRESEENLAITLKSIGDAVISTDTQGAVVRINPIAEIMTGWVEKEAVGKSLADVFHIIDGDTEESVENPADQVLRTGQNVALAKNTVLLARDGMKRQIADSAAPILDKEACIVGAVLVFRDVTEERKLQEQLRQSQKMEAIGQLAGGIAHDFNNILTAIIGNAQLLGEKVPPESEEASYVRELLNVADRASDLTRQLLAFSHKGNLVMRDINMHDVVAEAILMLRHSIGRGIKISESLEAESPIVHADSGQLQNAILNLGLNSRDAMPDGGNLQFVTRNFVADEDFCKLTADAIKPDLYLELEVTDTGGGMNAETMDRIFEPFFTTKPKGRGTGLGLPSVYSCIQSHQGCILANSELGKGAKFRIFLPVVTCPAQVESNEKIDRPIKGDGRVLIVDDEEIVRNFASDALSGLGYEVSTCADGQEAVDFYRTHYDDIDLVILDLVMPRLDGEKAFYEMKKINPDIRALVTSGFRHNSNTEALQMKGVSDFLDKPYRIEELSRAVAKYIKSNHM